MADRLKELVTRWRATNTHPEEHAQNVARAFARLERRYARPPRSLAPRPKARKVNLDVPDYDAEGEAFVQQIAPVLRHLERRSPAEKAEPLGMEQRKFLERVTWGMGTPQQIKRAEKLLDLHDKANGY
jgi:hypothetical protein